MNVALFKFTIASGLWKNRQQGRSILRQTGEVQFVNYVSNGSLDDSHTPDWFAAILGW
jgi:hypothetical protein